MSLSSELNAVIKQLQACRVSLALATEHVQFESDAYAQILLWSEDLAFVEMLMGIWMEEKGLEKEKRVFTRHIAQKSHTGHSKIDREAVGTDRKVFNEQWIGGKS